MASSGWASLGAALAGNPAREQAAFQQGALGSAKLEDLLLDARKKREAEVARASITPETLQSAMSGDPRAQAVFAAAALPNEYDPRQISGYAGQNLDNQIKLDAYGRVQNGSSIADVNPLLAVMEGKVQDVSKVQDGVSFNPTVAPSQNAFAPTQIGLAEIMQKGAQAEASRASASASYASAARQRAGIGLDKAANYEIVDTPDGLVRVPKLGGSAVPISFADGAQVRKAATGAAKTPNNEQSNAAGFASRMVAATRELGDLVGGGYDPTSLRDRTATAIGGITGNTLMSGQGQQYQQAAQNWVRANLRKESGAAIGRDEMDSEVRNYFPVAGDTAETIAQKERNRAIVEQNMIRTAGPAWAGNESAPAAAPSPASNVARGGARGNGHAVGDVINVNGRQYRVTGGSPDDPDVEPL